jgi:probable F420-dependent oxidoreductase
MQLDLALPVEGNQLANVAELAQRADQLGFAALWTPETQHDPFLPLLLAAQHARQLQIGTGVAIAFARSPMVVAQSAWDLQAFSGGRFLLGLGTQVQAHIERRFSAQWGSPVERMRDYIGALRAIWQAWQEGSALSYQGSYYTHTLMTPFFNPGPIEHPHIPIYLAGVNKGLASLAGELCEGFHVHPLHSPAYLREHLRPQIERAAERAGRGRDAVQLAGSVIVVTGRDETELAQARQRARTQIAFYASTPSYRVVLESHGWGRIGERLSRLAVTRRWAEMPALINDEMLAAFALEAEPDRLGAALYARYQGLLDRVTLYLPFVPGQNEAFWQGVIAGLKQASTK